MKSANRSKIGNKPGNPAYRTAAMFREKQFVRIVKSFRGKGLRRIGKEEFNR